MAIHTSTTELSSLDQAMGGFRQQLEQSMGVLDNLARVEAQFSDLAHVYQSLRDSIRQMQEGAKTAAEVEQRVLNFEKSLARLRSDLDTFQKDFENPRDAVQIYIDNLETRLRTELRAALNRIEQSGIGPAQVEKIEKMDSQVRTLKTNLRDAERRLQMMQSWLVATTLMAVVGLALPIVGPMIQPEATAPGPRPEVPTTPSKPAPSPAEAP